VHLVGFIIRIYHDVQSHERKICATRLKSGHDNVECVGIVRCSTKKGELLLIRT
jgi:hypothetical protein